MGFKAKKANASRSTKAKNSHRPTDKEGLEGGLILQSAKLHCRCSLAARPPSNMLVYLKDRSAQTNCMCCHTQREDADQTFHFSQSQYTDAGPTSPSADPLTPGAWRKIYSESRNQAQVWRCHGRSFISSPTRWFPIAV